MAKRKVRKSAKVTLKPKKKGQKPITFKAGGLHESTGTPKGEKIPTSELRKAKAGKLGKLAKKQVLFKENVLTGRKKK